MYSRRRVAGKREVRSPSAPAHARPGELIARYAPVALWVATALVVTLLGLRFGMRLVGVRGDVPFPGAVYRVTTPLIERFYSLFPASERFDYPAVEVASLAAIGAVLAIAVVIYAAGLVAGHLLERLRRTA